MNLEKQYRVPIAILATIVGMTLFLLLAFQAGTEIRPGFVQENPAGEATSSPPVPGGSPAQLRIPTIDVEATIEHVGLNSKNEIGIPKDFDNVAWYTGSVQPGQQGTSIIDGHLNNRLSLPAVFWDLGKLKVGDRIFVKTEDGTTNVFMVRGSESYDVNNAPIQKILNSGSGVHLNLITCTGSWIKDARMYDKRLVVYTDFVETIRENG